MKLIVSNREVSEKQFYFIHLEQRGSILKPPQAVKGKIN